MLKDLKSAALRASPTLLTDAAGLAALVIMLLVGLHLPMLTT